MTNQKANSLSKNLSVFRNKQSLVIVVVILLSLNLLAQLANVVKYQIIHSNISQDEKVNKPIATSHKRDHQHLALSNASKPQLTFHDQHKLNIHNLEQPPTFEEILNISDWKKWNQSSAIINMTVMNHAPVNIAPIWMEGGSVRKLIHYTQGRDYYVEWGSGGSTQVAGLMVNKKAFSIENFVPWCEKMKSNIMVQIAQTLDKLDYNCVDPGVPLRSLGRPRENQNKTRIGEIYVNKIDQIVEKIFENDENFDGILDAILIDGRYRVACALKLFSKGYVARNRSAIFVHDFLWRTRSYGLIRKYYDIIDPKIKQTPHGTMCVFTPKVATQELINKATLDLKDQLLKGIYE